MTPIPAKVLEFVEFQESPPITKLEDLVPQWLADNKNDGLNALTPAIDIEMSLSLSQYPEILWTFVQDAVLLATTKWQLVMIAAGPLEDLIARHGDAVIDRVEALARCAPRFRYVLTGVWPQGQQDSPVWERIEAARATMMPHGIDSDAEPPGPEGLG